MLAFNLFPETKKVTHIESSVNLRPLIFFCKNSNYCDKNCCLAILAFTNFVKNKQNGFVFLLFNFFKLLYFSVVQFAKNRNTNSTNLASNSKQEQTKTLADNNKKTKMISSDHFKLDT